MLSDYNCYWDTRSKDIRFIPFDYLNAGVYGSEEWINLAKPDPDLTGEFDKRVLTMEAGK